MGNKSGFTLLETLIAMAIMVIAFASILMVENASIQNAEKAKRLNAVGMLAKQSMIDFELKLQGKTFDEMQKEVTGEFKPPYDEFKWKQTIKEIEFPGFSQSKGASSNSGSGDDSSNAAADLITKLVTQYLSKALREITVTISWKRGSGEQSFTVTTYWVDLNHEFQLSQ